MCYMCTDASMCMLRAITSKAKPCTLIKLCYSVTSNTINKHDIVPLPLWHLEHGSMYVRAGRGVGRGGVAVHQSWVFNSAARGVPTDY